MYNVFHGPTKLSSQNPLYFASDANDETYLRGMVGGTTFNFVPIFCCFLGVLRLYSDTLHTLSQYKLNDFRQSYSLLCDGLYGHCLVLRIEANL